MSEDEQRNSDSGFDGMRDSAQVETAERISPTLEDAQFEARRGAMKLAMRYVARRHDSGVVDRRK